MPVDPLEEFRELNLDPSRSVMADRRIECAEYLGVHPDTLPPEKIAASKAWRNKWLTEAYRGVTDDVGAARAAASVSQQWAVRFLVGQCLYFYAREIVFVFDSILGRKNWKMLDHGCGAGDVALYARDVGHDVTLCDLSPGNLDLACWRFHERHLLHEAVAATPDDTYPPLPVVDCAVSSAVLEHLARPDEAIEDLAAAIRPGGVLIESQFLERPANIGGDHLASAAERRGLALDAANLFFTRVLKTKLAGVPVTAWMRRC